MPGNSFGQLFKITSFGESHGEALGVIIDGCPAGLPLETEDIQLELNRRRPGQNALTTARDEKDKIRILSGVFEGKTTGMPITINVMNENVRSKDYESIKNIFRPGHADFTYEKKYGHRDWRGGGRASARETLARVAAGAVAKKLLKFYCEVKITGYVRRIGKVEINSVDEDVIEKNPLRCPDISVLEAMTQEIKNAKNEHDSVGGIVEIITHNMPIGLGEPVFNKLSAELAKGIMSIPAVKGFEIGEGFSASKMLGSEHNLARSGGVLGGISDGEDLLLRFALKPVSSISKQQRVLTKDGEFQEISVQGRHDPCVCPRAVPIGEAMVALVLADHYLLNKNAKL